MSLSKKKSLSLAMLLTVLFAYGCNSDGSGDSTGSATDPNDLDGDGVANSADAFPNDPAESLDTDGDGVGNNADLDDDADGMNDDIDNNPLDTDNDGLPNSEDPDDDEDGVPDADDSFPLDNAESMDSDGDGIGDNADTDDSTGGTTSPPEAPGTGGTTDVATQTMGVNSAFICIPNPEVNGGAFFKGKFSGSALNEVYDVDNTVGCGGLAGNLLGTESTYNLSFQLPVTGGHVINLLLDIDASNGIPVTVSNWTQTRITAASPDLEVGGAGDWSVSGCVLNITAVDLGNTVPMVALVDGNLFCDPEPPLSQILVRDPVTAMITENTSITLGLIQFRGAAGILGGL